MIPKRVPIPEILEPLRRLHVSHIGPKVLLPRSFVEPEEVRYCALKEVGLQTVAGIVNDYNAGGVSDHWLLSGRVGEDGRVHVSCLGGHLWGGRGARGGGTDECKIRKKEEKQDTNCG